MVKFWVDPRLLGAWNDRSKECLGPKQGSRDLFVIKFKKAGAWFIF